MSLSQADDLQDYEVQAPSHNGSGLSSKNCTECDKYATNPLPESLLTQDTNTTDIARVNEALGTTSGKINSNNESKETK